MPTLSYEQLLAETLPARLVGDAQYDQVRARFGELLANSRRTAAETELMRLLGVLIEDYDRRHGLPPGDATAADRLRFLMDQSGKTPADLIAIFGQRSHVNEAINGKRPLSAAQARKLAGLFGVQPGLFIT